MDTFLVSIVSNAVAVLHCKLSMSAVVLRRILSGGRNGILVIL